MKAGILVILLLSALAYDPWSGDFSDCVVMRVNDTNITLWDIQKIVVLDLIFKKIAPDRNVVLDKLDRSWENYRNFFIIKCELDRIQYAPVDRAAFQRTAMEKIRKLDRGMLNYLKLYSISVTDAASFLYEKFRIRNYFQNFLFQLIDVKDREIEEYYKANGDKFRGIPLSIVRDEIKSLLLFKKKRKRLKEYVDRLLRTEAVEILKPDLQCMAGGKR